MVGQSGYHQICMVIRKNQKHIHIHGKVTNLWMQSKYTMAKTCENKNFWVYIFLLYNIGKQVWYKAHKWGIWYNGRTQMGRLIGWSDTHGLFERMVGHDNGQVHKQVRGHQNSRDTSGLWTVTNWYTWTGNEEKSHIMSNTGEVCKMVYVVLLLKHAHISSVTHTCTV